MDKRYEIHRLMEKLWGESSCEASHRWLFNNFHCCHVSDLSENVLDRCITALGNVKVVRSTTWSKLDSSNVKEAQRRKLLVQGCFSACSKVQTYWRFDKRVGGAEVFISPLGGNERFSLMFCMRKGGVNIASLSGFGVVTLKECVDGVDAVSRVLALMIRCARFEEFSYKYSVAPGFKHLSVDGLKSLYSVGNSEYNLGRLGLNNG